jgi:hypothetical protein
MKAHLMEVHLMEAHWTEARSMEAHLEIHFVSFFYVDRGRMERGDGRARGTLNGGKEDRIAER